ncbi:MAG: 50S ribosomal protein L25 [SAR324 cluster bacterium]|nr:50S ribosomal protein L25 [SAR324 cluster bacterium]
MSELFLDATPRTELRKSAVRKMRREGRLPAIVYGLHDPITIQLDSLQAAKLVQLLHGGERMVTLRYSDGGAAQEKQVLLREVQATPTGNRLLHIDFQEINTEKTVHVTVELRPDGTATGVRLGGILQVVKHEIVVECLPTAIPEYISLDVSALEIGDSLHMKDIVFAEGISPVTDLDETVIVVSAPKVEEEVEEEEVEEGEEGVEEAAAEGEDAAEPESDQE